MENYRFMDFKSIFILYKNMKNFDSLPALESGVKWNQYIWNMLVKNMARCEHLLLSFIREY